MGPRRIELAILPTPCHRLDLPELGSDLELWIKRDDLTGFAMGGNKARKLEYLMASVIDNGAEAVVTCGSSQSNFVRMLGAACSQLGIECHAAVMSLPYDSPAGKPSASGVGLGGNLILDELYGVRIHRFEDDDWEVLFDRAEQIAEVLEAGGKRVARIPIGGSTPLGIYGFYQAAAELTESFDWIVSASSSGSTQVGLTTAFLGTSTKVLGISCDPEPTLVRDFVELSERASSELGIPPLSLLDIRLNLDYVGPGYGVPSEAGNHALRWLAQRTGIILDPIYSAKAFAGLMDLVNKGEISGKVLFWHTGGTPTVFSDSALRL